MKIVGLIAEYNPFHNGHFYHIEKAKEITQADAAIVIMSGDYVQRGVPAIMPKRLRAEMALKCGAAAVFELPVCYATGTAELFAESAVSFLDQLGVVDSICFGTECGNLVSLQTIAHILQEEPDLYRETLQAQLKQGASFPAARQQAIAACTQSESLAALLGEPNNILGIEYLKALTKFQSSMAPYSIQRKGAHYHEETLQPENSSATAIRSLLAFSGSMIHTESTGAFEDTSFLNILGELETQVPSCCLELLKDYHRLKYPIYENDFSLLLKYKLLNKTPETLVRYMDVSSSFANRICGQLNHYFNYKQFCELLKTRDLTQTRVNRALLHIMLGIKKEDVQQFIDHNYHCYAHLLGFCKKDSNVISSIAKNSALPLLTKLYATEHLDETGKKMLNQDILASNLYTSVVTDKYRTAYENEYHQGVLKV